MKGLNPSLIPREGAPIPLERDYTFLAVVNAKRIYRDDGGKEVRSGEVEKFVLIGDYYYPIADIVTTPHKYRTQDIIFVS